MRKTVKCFRKTRVLNIPELRFAILLFLFPLFYNFFFLVVVFVILLESKHLIYALNLTVQLLKPLAKMTSKSISRVLIFLFCLGARSRFLETSSSEYSIRYYTLFSVTCFSFFSFSLFRGVFVFQE